MLEESKLKEKAMQIAAIFIECTVEEMSDIFHQARFKVLDHRIPKMEITEDQRIFLDNRNAEYHKEFLRMKFEPLPTEIKASIRTEDLLAYRKWLQENPHDEIIR